MVVTYKDWAEKLPFTLWGYRTSIRASIGATPYSLVYGSEVVLPIEVEIQSLRVLVETKVLEEDWAKVRYEQLALIDERRARVQYHAQGYQKRIAREFNKKVKPRNLKEGNLVLKLLRDETLIEEEKWSLDGLGLISLRRSCLEVLQESQIWMGKRCFAPLTWIGSENTTFRRKGKNLARLKTRKGSLDKN